MLPVILLPAEAREALYATDLDLSLWKRTPDWWKDRRTACWRWWLVCFGSLLMISIVVAVIAWWDSQPSPVAELELPSNYSQLAPP